MTASTKPVGFPSRRTMAWLVTVCGAVGLLASTVLLVEKIILLTDPGYTPSCSINPVLSCGSVMTTPQAEAFGFPNPLLGVVGFTALLTFGVVMLAGLKLPQWIHWGMWAGTAFGVVFVHWLIFQSLYRIGALCPYCMVVWVVTILIFWYSTLFNLTGGGGRVAQPIARGGQVAATVHTVVLVGWYLVIVVLIGEAFWTYWQTLL